MPLAEVANIDQRCYCLLHIEARMALLHILHSLRRANSMLVLCKVMQASSYQSTHWV